MGFTVVIGTFLPMLYYRIEDHKTIFIPRGVVIVVGLLVVSAGLRCSASAATSQAPTANSTFEYK